MPRASSQRIACAATVALAVALGCGVREVHEDGAAPRIAVLAPAAAEMVDRLGRGGDVVAIGDFVRRPASFLDRPRLGAYDAPNVERTLELRVDLVLTSESVAAAEAHRRLRELGVEVLALDTETVDGVLTSIGRLGERLDEADRAQSLVDEIRAGLDAVRDETASLPRRRVLFVVGRDPLYVAGPGSHLDALIELAGGVNVAADVGAPYRRLSLEAALERMPEVVIDTSDNRPGATRGRTAGSWARWSFLPAVEANRIWHVDPDRVVIPGVNLPATARRLARMIHPEVLGEPEAPGRETPRADGG